MRLINTDQEYIKNQRESVQSVSSVFYSSSCLRGEIMKFDYFTDDSEKSLAPFFSPIITSATLYSVVIVGGLFLVFWPWQNLVSFMDQQKGPLLFAVVFSATCLINAYVNLRCGRGEMGKSAQFTGEFGKKVITFEEERDFLQYGLIGFCLHTLFLLAPLLPFLILATSVSGLVLTAFAKACSVVFTASLLCRLFGFLMYLCWGRSNLLGYLLARIFLIVFIVLTAFWVPGINPFFIIYELNRSLQSLGVSATSSYVLYMVMVTSAMAVLAIVDWILVRSRITRTIRSHEDTKVRRS